MRHILLTGLAALCFACSTTPAPPPTTAARLTNQPTHEVATLRAEWHDPKRDRVIPVKLYFPRSTTNAAPIIIFSHGLGGTRDGYAYLGQYWAAHGYVVAHLQHAGSDDGVWRNVSLGERRAAAKRAIEQPRNALDRAADVSFAIDELTRWNSSSNSWRGKLDLEQVGVAGHSFGAHTTLAVAGARYFPLGNGAPLLRDSRVKAVIPMSSPPPANRTRLDEVFAAITIPCLHLTGTEDDSLIGASTADLRRIPYDHSRNSDQFLITFTDGDHGIFGGRERPFRHREDTRFQRLICLSSLAFWDAYLRDNTNAKRWLMQELEATLGATGTLEKRTRF